MLTTDIIDHSSSYRKVSNDEKKYYKAIVIGLSYNRNELCRVFRDKFTDNELNDLNSYRYHKISFKDKKITTKQLQKIRDQNNSLQNAMVDKLYHIGDYEAIANDIKVQICIYDTDDKDIFRTNKKYKYTINIMRKNDLLYVINKKVNQEIELQCQKQIIAGEKSISDEVRYKNAFPFKTSDPTGIFKQYMDSYPNHYKQTIAY